VEEVCEWELIETDGETNHYRAACGYGPIFEGCVPGDGNKHHCCKCGGKIKVKEKAKPAPKGLVEIEIVAGKTKYTGSMMYKFPGKEWEPIDHVIGRTATASDIEKWTVADKIENVLPPAPEGTVWFKPGPGDKWMEGDCNGNSFGTWGVAITSEYYDGWIGDEISEAATLYGHICRKPCTWTPLVLGWECECGYTFGHKPPRPDSCPKCKRPIKVAEPAKGLRYVECGEIDGVKVFKEDNQ
jgi:hypothetical protein